MQLVVYKTLQALLVELVGALLCSADSCSLSLHTEAADNKPWAAQ